MKLSNLNMSNLLSTRWSRFIATTVFLPVIVATLAVVSTMEANAAPGLQVGVLTCESVPGTRFNMLIHSSVDVECIFNYGGVEEQYYGETGIGIGLDLKSMGDEQIAYMVFTLSGDVEPGAHALAGDYIGGKASVAAGVGVGAAVLVGGGDKNFSLQPLALETSTGFGASAGVAYLSIWPADKE